MNDRTATLKGSVSSRLVLLAFLAIGGFFLVTEHRAHLFGILPYLLLLLCPLMHLFHRGHGKHHTEPVDSTRSSEGTRP